MSNDLFNISLNQGKNFNNYQTKIKQSVTKQFVTNKSVNKNIPKGNSFGNSFGPSFKEGFSTSGQNQKEELH